MSTWELFTWINVGVLAVGSVVVFVLFLKQVPAILGRSGTEGGDGNRSDGAEE